MIRNERTYPITLMVGAVFLLQGFLNSSPKLTVFFLVAGPLALLLALWPRVIVTDGGVTVVNARAHELAWDEIDGVEARSGAGSVNLVFRTGGRDLRAFAMRGSSWGGYFSSRESVERIAAKIDDERRRRTGQVRATPA